jgi:hypothetical protein
VKELLLNRTRRAFVAGEHRELAFDTARYYAVTERALQPDRPMQVIALDTVRWLIEKAGPAYLNEHGRRSESGSRQRDESGSGYGYRFLADCKRQGMTYEEARAALPADNGPAGEWARRKGERDFRLAWDGAPGSMFTWEDPDVSLLDDRRRDLPDFPLDAINPEWLRDWIVRAAHGAGTAIGYVAVPLLVAAGGLIGTARRIRPSRAWSQPMATWGANVGWSGDGKTPGQDVIKRAIDTIEEALEPEISNLKRAHDRLEAIATATKKAWQKEVEEAIAQNREPPPRPDEAEAPGKFIAPKLYATDITIEKLCELLPARKQGMLLLKDELADWFLNMQRYSTGTDNPFWLTSWNGPFNYSVDRIGRSTVKVPCLLVVF